MPARISAISESILNLIKSEKRIISWLFKRDPATKLAYIVNSTFISASPISQVVFTPFPLVCTCLQVYFFSQVIYTQHFFSSVYFIFSKINFVCIWESFSYGHFWVLTILCCFLWILRFLFRRVRTLFLFHFNFFVYSSMQPAWFRVSKSSLVFTFKLFVWLLILWFFFKN